MTPFVDDGDVRIYVGDAAEVLRGLPAESVDLVACSPPFYALRDYGVEGQIGLEATPEEWAAKLVAVFAECRRVLKPAGSMFVECGDSYGAPNSGGPSQRVDGGTPHRTGGLAMTHPTKPKDLLGQPFLLAFALRADGWYWRGCYPWAKPNAMPESAQDRCTTAHSYVLHFAKNARYHFDGDAIAEPAAWERWGDQTVPKYEGTDTASGWMKPKTKTELRRVANGQALETGRWDGGDLTTGRIHPDGRTVGRTAEDATKHPRSVWTIPTRGYPGAHFATWPMALAERIIKAGCPKGGTVLDPFFGAGTTAVACRRLGRACIGIELNPEYAQMAAERCAEWWKEPTRTDDDPDSPQLSLLAEGAA